MGSNLAPAPWVTSFTWIHEGKTLEISLYLAIQRPNCACSFIGPSPRGVNYNPRVELIAKGYKFYMGLYSEIFRNLIAKHKELWLQILVLVRGIKGFHVSASGAIQGHHGPLVILRNLRNIPSK